MKFLLLKDLLVQKSTIAVAGLYSLVFFLGRALLPPGPDVPESGVVYVLAGVVTGFMILVGSFKSDDNGVERFMYALPVSRLEAVAEKFLLLLAGSLWGTLGAALTGALFSLQALGASARPIGISDLGTILGRTGFVAVILPLWFRFGQRALRFLLFGLLGLGVAVQLLTVVLLLGRKQSGLRLDWFGRLLDFIFAYGREPGTFALGLFLAGLGCLAVCFYLSWLGFRRRDL